LKKAVAFSLCFCLAALLSAQKAPERNSFREVWAYLMAGSEKDLDPRRPISDLCYFGAGIDSTGALIDVPDIGKIRPFAGRKHLVLCLIGNYALTHFILDPALPFRASIIRELCVAAEPWDGVQLDFESVLSQDSGAFFSFVAELRARLPGKTVSLAVPARVDDRMGVWEYAKLDSAADRIVVMAYDEHWSGSSPGSIASLEWCRKVAAYAQTRIAPERLIMGLPFYGRAWADKTFSRSYKFSSVQKIIGEEKIAAPKRENGIPYFEYSKTVKVKVFYEDYRSLSARLSLYRGLSVEQVSFWCLGQEDPRIWEIIELNSRVVNPKPSPSPTPTPDPSPSPTETPAPTWTYVPTWTRYQYAP
jgi:spore germination protein YaaH